MTITIPVWLLWAVGIVVGVPLVAALIVFAIFGYVVAGSLSKGIWK